MNQTARTAPPPESRNQKPKGPIGLLFSLFFGLIVTVIGSWIFATMIEIVGMYTFWEGQGAEHAKSGLAEDYRYIQGFPKSLLVRDTEAFARNLAAYAVVPYRYANLPALTARVEDASHRMQSGASGTDRVHTAVRTWASRISKDAVSWLEASMYCAEDTLVRLAIAFYGLPAFAMAVCIGLVDGLVRRDLRKWSGGRESSFIYHHAKRFTGWFLSVGFGAYLAWPVNGLNPAYLVLIFACAVAISLSTTVSSFKKYL